jgi:hypothetical protein
LLELKSCHHCVQGTRRRVPVGFETPGIQGWTDAGGSCSRSPKNSGELQSNQYKINADELPNNASEFPVKWGVAGTRCQIGDCGKQQRPRVEKPQKWTADQEGKLELKSCHHCVQGTRRRVPVGFKTPGIQGRRDAGGSCSQSPKNSGELQGNQQKINADELPNNASEFQ